MSEKTTIHEGKYLRFCVENHWEYAERTNAGSAVIIIARTPEDKLLFVEQYRIPMGCNTIEMPAGLVGDLDAADTLELAAKRELLEETGRKAEQMELLGKIHTSNSVTDEVGYIFLARNLKREDRSVSASAL